MATLDSNVVDLPNGTKTTRPATATTKQKKKPALPHGAVKRPPAPRTNQMAVPTTIQTTKQAHFQEDRTSYLPNSLNTSSSAAGYKPKQQQKVAMEAAPPSGRRSAREARRSQRASARNSTQQQQQQQRHASNKKKSPTKSILRRSKPATESDNTRVAASVRSRFSIRKRVTLRANKPKVKKKREKGLHVLVCSANLGNAEPSLDDMAAWIPSQGRCAPVTPLSHVKRYQKECFDIVAVGMQESTWNSRKIRKLESNTSSLETSEHSRSEEASDSDHNNTDRSSRDLSKLATMIEETLGLKYQLLAEKQRGQMRLVIFVRCAIANQFTDLLIRCENTGVANVMANKGGIVMSFIYQKTRISFLSAHLAAHEGEGRYAARCDSLLEIFGGTHAHERYDVALASHHCFVLGDLNFRVRLGANDGSEHGGEDAKSSVSKALELIEQEDFETLYQHDELQAGIKKGHLLVDFNTLPCHFSPTFKVQREPGFVYKEQRTPSYTDRILYRSAVKGFLKPLAYEPCPDFSTSDHKPIRGAFSITPNAAVPKPGPSCSYKVTFRKMSCQDLPNVDMLSKSDPYIMLVWKHVNMNADNKDKGLMKWTSPRNKKWPKTRYISRTTDPVFTGQELDLTFNGPVGAEAILYISVMDYDLQSKDDLIGTLPINLRQLAAKLGPHQVKKSVSLDQPLTKYARQFGRIKMIIDIERFNTRVLSIRNDGQPGLMQRLACGK